MRKEKHRGAGNRSSARTVFGSMMVGIIESGRRGCQRGRLCVASEALQ